jgi:hypothetical protein
MVDISSVGEWKTNGEMIADIARLGFIRGRVCDLTYGGGLFWTHYRPYDLTSNDLDPGRPCGHHQDLRATTWASRSFGTVVLDVPYKMNGTPAVGEMDLRYGTGEVATRSERLTLLISGIAEGTRLTDDLLLVKIMDQVNSGKMRWMTDTATVVANACELRKVDSFMIRGGRKQPSGTSQQHARHEYSTLLVFGRK